VRGAGCLLLLLLLEEEEEEAAVVDGGGHPKSETVNSEPSNLNPETETLKRKP
jgi:hypothetical protein